ncbi:MAG: dihydropteridine reductase [Candidatus Syntrophoarchaeum sp. GoM_oil]|nr:MAG: dihydropteridine reductase [Candidatus Syntrophoarchaeum sp. GoM_oil]
MELYDVINSRRSIYNFKSDEVADEVILRVLEAGTMAPSAFNTQPWEFILVKDPATKIEIAKMREKILRQKRAIETAPMLLIVAYTPNEKLGDDSFASCFTAIENILLALAVEGLAGVIFAFRNKKLKEFLGLDEGMQIAAVIPLGIPAEEPGERKVIGIENKVHFDKFKGGEVK